jgi:hypothetical protein
VARSNTCRRLRPSWSAAMKWLPMANENASGVVAECAYEGTQVLHPAVVDPSQAPGHRPIAPGPVAHGQIDRQQFPREGEHACHADLVPGVAALLLHALQNLVGASVLPRIQQRVEEVLSTRKVPVEATPGDAKSLREQVHSHRIGAARGERLKPGFDPCASRCAGLGDHHVSLNRP